MIKIKNLSIIFFLLCVSFLFFACGNKKMPKPVVKEEMFFWKKVNFKWAEGCLFVEAELEGNCRNLKDVFLEVDEEGCLRCPFKGRFLNTSVIKDRCKLAVKACGITRLPFRFRLWGQNRFSGLDQPSDYFTVTR